MLKTLQNLVNRWFGRTTSPTIDSAQTAAQPVQNIEAAPEQSEAGTFHLVPFDENLLERARTQWQFGDWESLAQLDRETLQHHPDRAKLALLAAAGLLQIEKFDEARLYIRLAKDWGVSRRIMARILVAGVHNNLGRAAAIAGEENRALQHFQSAIATGSPGNETRLLSLARTNHQYQQLGLTPLRKYHTIRTDVFSSRLNSLSE